LVGGGTITFNCGPKPFTITVTTPKIIVFDTDLDGGGLLTISGGRKTLIFLVIGATVNLSKATFKWGWFSFGGAIHNDTGGKLNIDQCTFTHNRAPGPGDGGAIDNYGTLTVTNSTFAYNRTDGVSGAIENNGTMTVSNSTFYRNRALVGGAIASAGPLTITNCTFARNRTFFYGSGAALYAAGDTIVSNTIFANSWRGTNCIGSVGNGGNNLRWPREDTSCIGTFGNPRLGPLAHNGGLVRTNRLQLGSAAIGRGNSTACAATPVNNMDQRGFARPGTGATACSIGAYEYNGVPPP
jgi:hypothetical protein